jgi:hypothetical protein
MLPIKNMKGYVMLSSTTLFVQIITEIAARKDLSDKEIIQVARSVSAEPEFSNNREIIAYIEDLKVYKRYINRLQKYAYENNLKGLF